jgi:hypothetical protein
VSSSLYKPIHLKWNEMQKNIYGWFND